MENLGIRISESGVAPVLFIVHFLTFEKLKRIRRVIFVFLFVAYFLLMRLKNTIILYCSYNPEEHSSKQYEDLAEEELTQTQIHHLVVLERVFLSAKEIKKGEGEDEETNSSNVKNEELNSEINKQKALVAYLKVRMFSKIISL